MAQQQPQSELYNQNNPYMWPRSKCWIRAGRASIQHAATKVTYMDYFDYIVRLFVCFYTLPVWRIKFPNSSLRQSKPGVNLLR